MVGTLVRYAKKSNILVIATDNDREGEYIGFEIIEECKKVKRSLETKRMEFTAVTDHAIRHSLENLKTWGVDNRRKADASVAFYLSLVHTFASFPRDR